MKIERVEISGFRGIKRLSLAVDSLTTLIGENTWGKSSLLDALSVALPTDGLLYQFSMTDFHVDYALSTPQTQTLQILISFITQDDKVINAGRYRKIKPLWVNGEDNSKRIIYCMTGTRDDYSVSTQYSFLDSQGNEIKLHSANKYTQELISLHPVIRLKDSRRFNHLSGDQRDPDQRAEKRIANTCRRLLELPGHVNKGEMRSSLNAMNSLMEHYFSFKPLDKKKATKTRDGIFYQRSNHEISVPSVIESTHDKQTRLLFLGLLNGYLQAKGPKPLRRCARPLLIIEDPEGRLHPTHLARAWNLLQLLPMQKLLTTNSSELLSQVPLSSICRLIRRSDRTETRSISAKDLTKDDLRRVGFHVRFHRSSALYARCWLLVEGETEVWLFNELAALSGYNLAAEGIQIMEFAQSGLKSLIKTAKAFGIDWHVVTDGDAAGKKYAMSVENLLGKDLSSHRLTVLPDHDIEHYLYNHGFEDFFKQLIKISPDHAIPPKKVVTKVLKKFAKPDLAIAIAKQCEQQGAVCIPKLLRQVLQRVLTMAHGNT